MKEFKRYHFHFKLVRSFALGFVIYSPTLNGLAFDINIACFSLHVGSKGNSWVGANSFWNG